MTREEVEKLGESMAAWTYLLYTAVIRGSMVLMLGYVGVRFVNIVWHWFRTLTW